MSYFLGVDVGTSSVKAVAFNGNAAVLAHCTKAYSLQHPQSNYSEQNADEMYAAIISTIQDLVIQMNMPPLAVGFSTAMHQLLCCDAAGTAVSPLITWADNRADGVAKKLAGTKNAAAFYAATGVPLHPMSPLCKLLWLKENNAPLFSSTNKFTGIKEYIIYKLCNRWLVDSSLASATGLFNMHTLQWDEGVLNFIGIDNCKLATVVAPTEIFYVNSKVLPQLANVPVVVGGSDGVLAAFAGQQSSGCSISLSIGTSAALRRIHNQPLPGRQGKTFCYHLHQHQYVSGGPTNNGAVVLQWLKEKVLQSSDTYEMLLEKAARVPPGSDGLLFLPYLLGERAPLWDTDVQATFFGLTAKHGQAHFVRAVLEGIAYNILWISELMQLQPGETVYTTGGFAKSPFWLQLMADVLNCKLLHSAEGEGAALGAALMAAMATAQPLYAVNNSVASYQPNALANEAYQQNYTRYRRLYTALHQAGLFQHSL